MTMRLCARRVLFIALMFAVCVPVAVRADWVSIEDNAAGIDARVWANDGGQKIPRELLFSFSTAGETTLSEVWDGSVVRTFGARNEVVSVSVIVDNNGVDLENVVVTFDELTNTDTNYVLATTEQSTNKLFDWRNRPIEVFVVEYLRIHGLSKISYNFYDETHIPSTFQRPILTNAQPISAAQGTGVWSDRPHHDLSYPDIATPQELRENGTTIETSSSQIFWIDLYIPKDAPAGILSGNITISANGVEATPIPIEVEVYDFELPDERHSKTMVYIEPRDIKERYFSGPYGALAEADKPAYRETIDKHFMLAWRHGISLIDANELFPDEFPEVNKPNVDWIARLTGNLYTASNGYAGPGANLPHDVYSVGSYGAWAYWWDLRQYNPISETYDPDAPLSVLQTTLEEKTDLWETWFQENAPATTRFLYVDDEPTVTLAYSNLVANLTKNSPVAGDKLDTLVTANPVNELPALSDVTTLAALISVGSTTAWEETINNNPELNLYMYNGHRPASGTFATDDEGVALRELAWGQYKKSIDRWFYWHATYYNNTQGGAPTRDMDQIEGGEGLTYRMGSYTNVFKSAHTFGGHSMFDPVLGETGFNYGNGDGVLFYPGTDEVFPEESRGLDGPIASLRLKHWRRGIQDVQYLQLAKQVDVAETQAIVEQMVPEALWEIGVHEEADPSYVHKPPSWSTNSEDWEAARRDLAELITSTSTTAPSISSQPQSETVLDGTPVEFFVVASANPAPTYQWRKDAVVIPGATSAELSFTATPDDAGSYDVVVTNTEGNVTSTAAILTVDPALTAPVIVSEPVSLTVIDGDDATFSVIATGNPEPTYQWRKDSVALPGAIVAELSFTSTPDDAGSYDVVVTNSEGDVTSTAAILTVDPALTAPVIVSEPVSLTVIDGDDATFSVIATGNPEPTYQWRKDGVALPGAIVAELSFTSTPDDAGSYDVVVTNSEGDVTSTAAILTVNPALTSPVIVSEPVSLTVIDGDDATFSVIATGNPEPTYQWRKDGVDIPGATSAELSFTATPDDAGSYEVVVTNSQGDAISVTVVLTVDPALNAPVIIAQPASLTTPVGSSALFSVSASGNPEPTFQWQKDGAPIVGETGASLSILATGANVGAYDVVISNPLGNVTSAIAMLDVTGDILAPELLSAVATSNDSIELTFNEAMSASVNILQNFTLDQDQSVLAVEQTSPTTVQLSTTDLAGAFPLVVGVLNVEDLFGNVIAANSSLTIAAGPVSGSCTFEQSTSSNHLLIIEAENFTELTARSAREWIAPSNPVPGFSGTTALQALPDARLTLTSGYAAASPELSVNARFQTTGTHYLWVRGHGRSGGSDSVHVGLNGIETPASRNISVPRSSGYEWSSGTHTVDVASAGVHSLQIWMREDGVYADKIILTTNPDFVPTGAGPLESLCPGGGSGDQPPTIASISPQATLEAAAVEFSVIASDDNPNPTLTASGLPAGALFNENSGQFSWTPPLGSAGLYEVTFNATDSADQTTSLPVTITVSAEPTLGSCTFEQSTASDHLLTIEAENFSGSIDRGNRSWTAPSNPVAGFSGTTALQALPDARQTITAGYAETSPELSVTARFQAAGTHYIWVRGHGPSGGSNSVHVGFNGVENLSSRNISIQRTSGYEWSSGNHTVDVPSAGVHSLQIWMREDGVYADKIILTTNPDFVPTGAGPLESLCPGGGSGDQPPTLSPIGPQAALEDVALAFTVVASDDNSSPTLSAAGLPEGAVFDENTGQFNWTPSIGSAGDYDVTFVATDNANQATSLVVTITVSAEPLPVSCTFAQSADSDHVLTVEAENFPDLTERSGRAWTAPSTPVAGFSGTTALQALPDARLTLNSGFAETSPELSVTARFEAAGTHYIWVRGHGRSGGSDSLHVGLNGIESATSQNISIPRTSGYEWSSGIHTVDVPATGLHSLQIWMREDGVYADKIILTTDPSFVPGGTGPAESNCEAPL